MGGGDGIVPVLPARGIELGFGAAMPLEQRAVHCEAGPRQALREEAQLDRRAAEAVDEEKADAAILAKARLVIDVPVARNGFT
jgi:hypothetical protein